MSRRVWVVEARWRGKPWSIVGIKSSKREATIEVSWWRRRESPREWRVVEYVPREAKS